MVLRPRADADIDEIFAYLRHESMQAAVRFLDSAEAAFRLLGEHPAIGSTRHAEFCPELPDPLRFHPLEGFPRVLVYYIDRTDAVEIIRVWDAARGLDALMGDLD